MKRISALVMVLLTVGFCNATYTWEYWTTGDFLSKDFTTDQGFEMTGGYGNVLRLFENSVAIIENTDPLGIQTISTNNQSLLYLNGGTIGILISDQGRRQSIPDDPPVSPEHIFMTVLDYDYDDITAKLTGMWQDYSTFDIQLVTGPDTTFEAIDNIAFTIVPEPATLSIMCLGVLLLKKRRAS